MSNNRVRAQGRKVNAIPTKGIAGNGNVVAAGAGIAGVCEGNPDAGGAVVIDTEGVYNLTVLGLTVGAVLLGDLIYCHAASNLVPCTLDNVAAGGVRLGTAEAATAADAVIPVKLRNA